MDLWDGPDINLWDWRGTLLPDAFLSGLTGSDLGVYQFGVFSGDSMFNIGNIIHLTGTKIDHMLGFDVFTGMPKELAEPIFQDAWNPDIMPDYFNALIKYEFNSAKEYAEHMEARLRAAFPDFETIIFDGLVEEILPNIESPLPKAFYVDCDFDIYTPTKFGLDFLIKKGLIVPGTLIGYDDWGGTPHDEFQYGESRAHREIIEENGMVMTMLGEISPDNGINIGTLWRVDEINA